MRSLWSYSPEYGAKGLRWFAEFILVLIISPFLILWNQLKSRAGSGSISIK